ncbi:MAG: hypothetical protein EXR86_05760 [Gammaproteobacteria bacterium]|nr:hypothetical protein [Gammaproteobacteria bacterium]
MNLNRRQFIGVALLFAGSGAARWVSAAGPAVTALDNSKLIYLSPLLADGRESTCHAEIWFVQYQAEVYVCTSSTAWRTLALKRGLTRARIWIGEFGAWTQAKDAFRAAPTLLLEGQVETAPAVHAEVLEVFGKKYAAEWAKWGPQFRDELADGSRALLRYRVAV